MHQVYLWSSGLHSSVGPTSPLTAFTCTTQPKNHPMQAVHGYNILLTLVLTLCLDKAEFVLSNLIIKLKLSCCRTFCEPCFHVNYLKYKSDTISVTTQSLSLLFKVSSQYDARVHACMHYVALSLQNMKVYIKSLFFCDKMQDCSSDECKDRIQVLAFVLHCSKR